MIYNIIRTGSKGNAVVYHDLFMVDCGVPYKALQGVIQNVKVILLTHVHKDHLNHTTIKKLAFEKPNMTYIANQEVADILIKLGIDEDKIIKAEINESSSFTVGHMFYSIYPVKLYHDVENIGYRIIAHNVIEMSEYKIFHATDTVTLEGISAKDYDLYAIEYNHCEIQIEKDIAEKLAKGEYAYELGSKETHLSFQKADKFIKENAKPDSEVIKLHVSHKYEI